MEKASDTSASAAAAGAATGLFLIGRRHEEGHWPLTLG